MLLDSSYLDSHENFVLKFMNAGHKLIKSENPNKELSSIVDLLAEILPPVGPPSKYEDVIHQDRESVEEFTPFIYLVFGSGGGLINVCDEDAAVVFYVLHRILEHTVEKKIEIEFTEEYERVLYDLQSHVTVMKREIEEREDYITREEFEKFCFVQPMVDRYLKQLRDECSQAKFLSGKSKKFLLLDNIWQLLPNPDGENECQKCNKIVPRYTDFAFMQNCPHVFCITCCYYLLERVDSCSVCGKRGALMTKTEFLQTQA